MEEGSRSEGLVSLQFQNQSVQCHLPPSQQVWWHMIESEGGILVPEGGLGLAHRPMVWLWLA